LNSGHMGARPTVALLVDWVPPWEWTKFDAVGALMDIFIVETQSAPCADCLAPVRSGERFRRVSVCSMWHPEAPRGEVVRDLPTKIFQTLDLIRPDAVIVTGYTGKRNLAGLLWSVRKQVPAVVASDSIEHERERQFWKEVIKRQLLALFASGLAASQSAGRYLSKLGMEPQRIVVGPLDSVDNDHFVFGADNARQHAKTVRQQLGLPRQYFLAVSRLTLEKNIGGLLEAYVRYRQRSRQEPWHLVIVGTGPLENTLRKRVTSLGLAGSVHMPGFVPFDMIPAYYGLASGFVHPSLRDTWGLVINEAMAVGLPVIVSDCCGAAPELIRDGHNGFTFNPHDHETLAGLMLGIAEGLYQREVLGKEGHDTIAGWTPLTYAGAVRAAVEVAFSAPLLQPRRSQLALLSLLMRSSSNRGTSGNVPPAGAIASSTSVKDSVGGD
jgi:glycosyltransferase involved in cell wall biosynthesis